MNIFKRLSLAYKIFTSTAESNLQIITQSTTSSITYKSKYSRYYNECAAIQSCMIKRTSALNNGVLMPVNEKKEQIKSTKFNEIKKVLDAPNMYQTFADLIATIEVFKLMYGCAYVYKFKSLGSDKITGLVVIPNDCISVQYSTDYNYFGKYSEIIQSYTISIGGRTFTFQDEQVKDIELFKDKAVNITNPVLPHSRMIAISDNIDNYIGSVNSRNTIITKRGAEGILTPERSSDDTASMIAMDDKERSRIQTEYAKYGSLSSQWHTLISKIPMKFQNISRTPQQLGLFESENADFRTIAGTLEVPIPLLGLPDTTKFNTYLEAKKEFYDDTIIPEADSFGQFFKKMFNVTEFNFYFDFSHLSFLQKDEKLKVEVYQKLSETLRANIEAGLITEAEVKELLKEYL